MNKIIFSVKHVLLGTLIAFGCLLSMASHAQMRESCDLDFWQVMGARATMEGEREVEMAQKIIVKPDSVLEYSCFKVEAQRMNNDVERFFSNNAGPRFFDTPLWIPNDIFQPTILSKPGPIPWIENSTGEGILGFSDGGIGEDNPEKYPGKEHHDQNISLYDPPNDLGNMVMESLHAYILGALDADGDGNPDSDGNFSHSQLGGHIPNNFPECDIMQRVWDFARCERNFQMLHKEFRSVVIDGELVLVSDWVDEDGNVILNPVDNFFYTFDDLNPFEPRQKPTSCFFAGRGDSWDAVIGAANPEANEAGGVQVNLKIGSAAGTRDCDDPTAFMKYLTEPNPPNNGTADPCDMPIPIETGVIVEIEGLPKKEGVCVRPGMSFFPDAEVNGRDGDRRCRFTPP